MNTPTATRWHAPWPAGARPESFIRDFDRFGLYDTAGNVGEWTASSYDASYGGTERQVVFLEAGGTRVLRGGSWGSEPVGVRSAFRSRLTPALRVDYGGFRLARTP